MPEQQSSMSKRDVIGRSFLILCFGWVSVLGLLLLSWQRLVNSIVPEPYLDEIFHIPQAQRYCSNNLDWDPKITTPPGLYLFSRFAHLLGVSCTPSGLRGINAILTILTILPASFTIRASSHSFAVEDGNQQHRGVIESRLATDLHTAVNTCLFPPMFTFTALYYTDIGSTAMVLLFIASLDGRASFVATAYKSLQLATTALVSTLLSLQGYFVAAGGTIILSVLFQWLFRRSARHNTQPNSMYLERSTPSSVLLLVGVFALFFRQTNIFWVAVFPIGWRFLSHSPRRSIDEGQGILSIRPKRFEGWASIINPTVDQADLLDYVRTAASTIDSLLFYVGMSLPRPSALIPLATKLFLPFAMLGVCFAAFVAYNGGVVLGDKSNHVATLHSSQMLYIWPFMVFFSIPLMYPYLLVPFIRLPARLSNARIPLAKLLEPYKSTAFFQGSSQTAKALGFIIAAGIVVHYNTIIHPFTLADNRHYVFYMFRLIILNNPRMRYLVVPLYVIAGWLTIRTLGTPYSPPDEASLQKADEDLKASMTEALGPELSAKPNLQRMIKDSKAPKSPSPAPDQVETRVGFVLLWMITTAMCVVSTPLVEPRYFILPWMVWRLQVPSPSNLRHDRSQSGEKQQNKSTVKNRDDSTCSLLLGVDHRLWLETIWFLAINFATGYLFLYRGFEWPQEPGKVQRFIW